MTQTTTRDDGLLRALIEELRPYASKPLGSIKIDTDDIRKIVDWFDASSPVPAGGVGAVAVKKLEWHKVGPLEWRAITVFGDAVIHEGLYGDFVWRIAPHTLYWSCTSGIVRFSEWFDSSGRTLADAHQNPEAEHG